MRIFIGLALALGLARAHAAPCEPVEPWLTIEITASEMEEPAEVVDVSREGCATVRYAEFDVRRGVYARVLDADELGALAAIVESSAVGSIDARRVADKVRASEALFRGRLRVDGPELHTVACGDTVRLLVSDVRAAAPNAIQQFAPRETAQRHRDVAELQAIVDVLDAMQAIGRRTHALATGAAP